MDLLYDIIVSANFDKVHKEQQSFLNTTTDSEDSDFDLKLNSFVESFGNLNIVAMLI